MLACGSDPPALNCVPKPRSLCPSFQKHSVGPSVIFPSFNSCPLEVGGLHSGPYPAPEPRHQPAGVPPNIGSLGASSRSKEAGMGWFGLSGGYRRAVWWSVYCSRRLAFQKRISPRKYLAEKSLLTRLLTDPTLFPVVFREYSISSF